MGFLVVVCSSAANKQHKINWIRPNPLPLDHGFNTTLDYLYRLLIDHYHNAIDVTLSWDELNLVNHMVEVNFRHNDVTTNIKDKEAGR